MHAWRDRTHMRCVGPQYFAWWVVPQRKARPHAANFTHGARRACMHACIWLVPRARSAHASHVHGAGVHRARTYSAPSCTPKHFRSGHELAWLLCHAIANPARPLPAAGPAPPAPNPAPCPPTLRQAAARGLASRSDAMHACHKHTSCYGQDGARCQADPPPPNTTHTHPARSHMGQPGGIALACRNLCLPSMRLARSIKPAGQTVVHVTGFLCDPPSPLSTTASSALAPRPPCAASGTFPAPP